MFEFWDYLINLQNYLRHFVEGFGLLVAQTSFKYCFNESISKQHRISRKIDWHEIHLSKT